MKRGWSIGCLLFWCFSSLNAAEVTVFAASSLADALGEIAKAYESGTKETVRFNLAGSNTLARQIKEGAPASLFFSADEAKMDDLEKQGLIIASSRRNRLANSLVVVVPMDSQLKITMANDLTSPEVKRVAVGDPAAVPAGVYAREYFVKLGLWAAINPKIVPTADVRGALAAVAAGNAEAGIVYKTDAAASPKVKLALEITGEDSPKIRYPVALVKDAPEPEAARRFLAFLFSERAGGIFRKHGFQTLEPHEPN